MSKLSPAWWRAVFIIATLAGAGILTAISVRDFRTAALPPGNRPIQSQISDYVSSNACRACHVENYETWHGSFHRTMTQVESPRPLLNGVSQLDYSFHGPEYKGGRCADKFYVRMRSTAGRCGDRQSRR